MLKHSLLALTLAGLIYAAPAVAQNDAAPSGAQNNAQSEGQNSGQTNPAPGQPSAPAAHGWRARGHGEMDPAKRTEMLSRKLKLTADQQAKVQDILKSEKSQMDSLHNESSMSRDDRRAKMTDIHKSSDDQVRALLDPTQQKKWDGMQTRREQRAGHRHGTQPPPSDSGQ